MKCPECGSTETDVKDSRPNGDYIKRRRICECGNRFSTFEVPAESMLRLKEIFSADMIAEKINQLQGVVNSWKSL